MSVMDQDFKTFLSKKGISEDEFRGGSLKDKTALVETFEKSKQSKKSIICFYSSFFALFLSFPVYYHLVFLHVV